MKAADVAKVSANGREPKILSVSDILDAADLAEEVVELPEWGGAVRVRALSLEEQFEINTKAQRDGETDLLALGMLAVLHATIEPRFSEEHLVLLQKKGGAPMTRLMRVITRLSGMSEEVVAAAKATFPARAGTKV